MIDYKEPFETLLRCVIKEIENDGIINRVLDEVLAIIAKNAQEVIKSGEFFLANIDESVVEAAFKPNTHSLIALQSKVLSSIRLLEPLKELIKETNPDCYETYKKLKATEEFVSKCIKPEINKENNE